MNRKYFQLASLVVLALSTGIGWLLGRRLFPNVASPAAVSLVQTGVEVKPDVAPAFEDRIDSLLNVSVSSVQVAAVSSWSEFTNVAEIRANLDRLSKLENSGAEHLARVLLLKEWLRIDPSEILDYATSEGRDVDQSLLSQIALLWAEQDPSEAIAALLKYPLSDHPRSSILTQILEQVAAEDPSAALGLLQQHDFVGHWDYREVFAALASENLENAKIIAATVNSGVKRGREGALSAVGGEWARTDGLAAIRWLQSLEDADGSVVREAIEAVANTWCSEAPQEFLKNLASLPKVDNLGAMVAYAASMWWRSDPEKALAWIDDSVVDPDLKAQMNHSITQAAAKDDPAAAFDMASKLPAGDRRGVFAMVAEQAIVKDPEATVDWISTLDNAEDRKEIARIAVEALAQRDPAAVVAQFATLKDFIGSLDPVHTRGVWDELIPHLAAHDITDATAWLETMPPQIKRDALTALARTWVTRDPQAAANYLAVQPDSDNQVRATQEVIGQWARHQPVEASQWVETLAEGQNRELAAKNIASNWAILDPVEAAKWIDDLPVSRSRDQAAAVFASETISIDPQNALRIASTIGDEKSRRKSIMKNLTAWARFDQQAAAAAVKNLPIANEEREAISTTISF